MSEFTQRSEKQKSFISPSRSAAEDVGVQGAEVVDNRAEAHQLAQMKSFIDNGQKGVAPRFLNGPTQLAGAEEELPAQGKFATTQLAGPEEELPAQGKFATTQLAGAEEELPAQGKFATTQLAGPEEELPAQGKFATTQLAGPEEELPAQGKFATTQLAGPEEELQGKFATTQLAGPEEELQGKFATTQLAGPEEELQGKFATTQLAGPEEELQGKFAPVQRQEAKPNTTGMPNHVKSNIETMSGVSLDDAKVHYDSPKPAQLNAYAFAQGKDIHIGPGQEKHLGHEAWHLTQQAKGQVAETKQLKQGVSINDDPGLEHEADVMGAKAMSSPEVTRER